MLGWNSSRYDPPSLLGEGLLGDLLHYYPETKRSDPSLRQLGQGAHGLGTPSNALAALPLDDLKTTTRQLRSSITNKRLAPYVPPGTADDLACDPAKFTNVDRALLAAEPTLDEVARRILAQRK